MRHLEVVEDAVQGALLAALTAWTAQGLPDDPGAWLYRVAYNNLIGDLRRKAGRLRILERAGRRGVLEAATIRRLVFRRRGGGRHAADALHLLRRRHSPGIAAGPRAEDAVRVQRRGDRAAAVHLRGERVQAAGARARPAARGRRPTIETPPLDTLKSRLPSVHAVLYLLFNEGYLSAHAEQAIRRELCDEAVRLATLLAEHPVGAVPETFALLALMHLHAARLGARRDATGGLLLLEEQDRSLWDRERMRLGAEWLERSASGDVFSRFHAEAGIAAEHCFAPSFAQTRWKEIADLYAMLERIDPSPLHTMNRAVAVAEWQGPEAGLAVLQLAPPAWLAGSYLWDAVLGDLHRRAGNLEIAQRHRERALASAPTEAVRDLLRRRLATAA